MDSIADTFDAEGVVLLRKGENPYSADEIDQLFDLCLQLPHPPGIGEENRVGVGRILVDPVDIVRGELGYEPAQVEAPELAGSIMKVAASEKAMAFWADHFGTGEVKLCRAQTNFLYPDGEVGFHNDHESNPDYRLSIVVGLSDAYTGGYFIAELPSGKQRLFRLSRGEVLVSKPELQHAVSRVESGERMSLVMFTC